MDIKQKILSFMKIKGPVIPSQVSKEIGSNILMASAYLSELSSKGQLKVSNLKIGGTPLYFLPGQEAQLQNFSDNLNSKQKKAYEILKQEKVLKDSALEPVVRVALRDIKDFAVPLQVTYNNHKEMFWRWYLSGKKEIESIIKSFFEEEKKPEEKQETLKKEVPKEEDFVKGTKNEKPEEKQTEEKIHVHGQKKQPKDLFLDSLNSFFEKNKIKVKNTEVIRKNSEIDFLIEVPSNVGDISYYCKAKNKKRISENDLGAAYAQGQIKKLPVLFLTNGTLIKKAQEILEKDFNTIKVKKLE